MAAIFMVSVCVSDGVLNNVIILIFHTALLRIKDSVHPISRNLGITFTQVSPQMMQTRLLEGAV